MKKVTKEPFWLNRKQMAEACGISVQAFEKWGVKPVAKLGRETFYLVEDVIENRVARSEQRSNPGGFEDQVKVAHQAELDYEKLLLTREQRVGQELKNAQTRRELAPVQVIDWALSKVGGQIAAVLESIPLKLKKLCPRLSASEIEAVKREVVKAQNAAARVTVDLDDYYERDPAGDQPGDSPRA